jgi:hypothetical protein
VYTYVEAPEEIAPVVADPKGKKKKVSTAADPKKKAGGRGPMWNLREDECLAEAWKTVSIDPFTGANQNAESYWKRVKAAFDERRLLDPYFKALTVDRNVSAMSHRWHMIQHACNKWHDTVEEVPRVHICGTNFEDQVQSMLPPCIALVHRRFYRPPFLCRCVP